MRVIAVKNPKSEAAKNLVHEMHLLRARIFKDRLAWDVCCSSGLETDQFDELKPVYILCLDTAQAVIGCARLLPASNGTMLEEVFPQLLDAGRLLTHHRMIESSRFCVDTSVVADREQGGLHSATLAMFAGIVEWSILNGYREIVTATDVGLERIFRRAGWPLSRLGPPSQINETRSVAGLLPADWQSFDLLRPSSYVSNFRIPQEEEA
ncbi:MULTISPECIES: acyl-homoserine-lactone synthase TraI [unclassified Rhizobium]|uniref:acyl-homoserine-lactone synthase n=1 Tax=unclassified Rhizobium TaxID=2613769 RepID=UPI0006FD938F|nr:MULTISPECIES: acyl-homoserine-lactone synthase TraI [unclassified Rhizobium]KQV39936.1 autoinducer synthesis protein [Rhizobium sp. Root1212]KRD31646.1 autoinducer synthesis protein [Rhizobium sp. Root268]